MHYKKVMSEEIHGVVAIACEKELRTGLMAAMSKAIFAVPNLRPHGYCKDTDVYLDEVKRRLKNSSSKTDVRYECIRILREIDEKEIFAQELISEKCSQADWFPRDKNLLTELVNGVIRHRLSLDTLISFFSKIPLNKIEPWVSYALRLGLYQIVYLDKIPASAAINTSVELVKKLVHRTDAVRFTNAILRSIERCIQNKSADEPDVTDRQKALHRRGNTWCTFQHSILPNPDKNLSAYLAVNYSHPEWLIKRWLSRYGKDKTIEICKINNLPPKVFLRINHRKISPQEFILLLEKKVSMHTPSIMP